MFCPNCKREYPKEIDVCPDCQVKLVRISLRRVEQKTENLDLVGIGKFQDPGYAAKVVAFLNENGVDVLPVEYRFKNITRLFVRKQDVLEAKELLKAFKTLTSNGTLEDRSGVKKLLKVLGIGVIMHLLAGLVLVFTGIVVAVCTGNMIVGGAAILIGVLSLVIFGLLYRNQTKLEQKGS